MFWLILCPVKNPWNVVAPKVSTTLSEKHPWNLERNSFTVPSTTYVLLCRSFQSAAKHTWYKHRQVVHSTFQHHQIYTIDQQTVANFHDLVA